MTKVDSFTGETRRELEGLLGRDSNRVILELERLVRLHGRPKIYARETEAFRAELTRLGEQVAGAAAALKGSSPYFRHIVAGVPEALRALEVLSTDMTKMRTWFQRPPNRPRDQAWERLRRNVGFVMRASGEKLTTAPPRGHHPRAAKLWRVLAIVSLKARHKPINSRDGAHLWVSRLPQLRHGRANGDREARRAVRGLQVLLHPRTRAARCSCVATSCEC